MFQRRKGRHVIGCEVCRDEEAATSDYYGTQMCDDCIEFDRTADLDEYEAKKRERIAEQQEY